MHRFVIMLCLTAIAGQSNGLSLAPKPPVISLDAAAARGISIVAEDAHGLIGVTIKVRRKYPCGQMAVSLLVLKEGVVQVHAPLARIDGSREYFVYYAQLAREQVNASELDFSFDKKAIDNCGTFSVALSDAKVVSN